MRLEEFGAVIAVEPEQEECEADAWYDEGLATDEVSVPQMKIGMRLIDMAAARVRIAVTTKFAELTVVEMPRKIIPSE